MTPRKPLAGKRNSSA